jgi:hypothetical protein
LGVAAIDVSFRNFVITAVLTAVIANSAKWFASRVAIDLSFPEF